MLDIMLYFGPEVFTMAKHIQVQGVIGMFLYRRYQTVPDSFGLTGTGSEKKKKKKVDRSYHF